jgi:hypothetical protein
VETGILGVCGRHLYLGKQVAKEDSCAEGEWEELSEILEK